MSRNKKYLQKSDLDICVLTAGRKEMLWNCLESIQADIIASEVSANVCLFNNGADDIGDKHPVVKHYDSISKNRGFPYGANSALRMGKSSIAIFVSDDIVLIPGFNSSILKTMKSDPSIGLCGAKLLFPPKSTDPIRPAGKVQHVGHAMDINARIIHPLVGWSPDNPKCCISREVFSVTGAIFGIRREAFEKVRGFDEVFGLGTYEDVDMALKIRQAGYKIWIDTNAVAYHYVGATFELRQEAQPLQQNNSMFLQKWMQTGLMTFDNWTYM
jgi:GT2 family glycosyltransferase